MRKDLTIRDISRLAEVSTATVSRVLAGSPKVKEETRQRVQRIIEESGYEPNHLARSLAVNRSNTIGVVVEDIGNPFFVEVARGVQSVLGDTDFTMLLASSRWEADKELTTVRTFLRNRVDGILLSPISVESSSVQVLDQWGLPFVLLTISSESDEYTTVCTDNVRGGYLAAKALIETGVDSIACLQGFPHQNTFDRIRGFEQAINEDTSQPSTLYRVVENVRTFDEGYNSVQSLLADYSPEGGRRLGVFATNDDVAMGVLSSLYDHRVRVPEDVAVVGFDDIPTAKRFQIPLTTVAQPKQKMGSLAATELLEMIKDPERERRRFTLLPRLIQRASTNRLYTMD